MGSDNDDFFLIQGSNENADILQHRNPRVSSQTSTPCVTSTVTSTADMRKLSATGGGGLHGIWRRLHAEYQSIPWDRLKSIKWKNERAVCGQAYRPTEVGAIKPNHTIK